MTVSPFRPLSALEIITQSLRLFQGNLALLVIVAALPHAVLLGVRYLLERAVGEPSQLMIAALVAAVALTAVTLAAITAAVAGIVLGFPPTVSQAYRLTLAANPVWVVLAFMLTGVMISLGFMFFIFPGLILGGFLAPIIPIIVLESRTPTGAIARSFAMMRAELPKGMIVFAFVVLVSEFVPLAIQVAAGVGPYSALLGAAIRSLTLPLGFTANVLLYLSIRAGEGYTLEQLETDIRKRAER